MQLGIGRNVYLDGEHLTGLQFTGGDGLGILDVFAGINQKRSGLFGESSVFRPSSHYAPGGIMEQDLDSLFGRKEQLHRALAMIGEKNVHRKLAHLGELGRFRRQIDS